MSTWLLSHTSISVKFNCCVSLPVTSMGHHIGRLQSKIVVERVVDRGAAPCGDYYRLSRINASWVIGET